MASFFEFNTNFIFYGSQHITVILLTIGLSIVLPLVARKQFSPSQQLWTSRIMAIMISSWALLYVLILLYLGKFNYKTDIPLDICNMTALVLPFVMWTPSKKIFPYLYFWILTGTTQAVLAPHLFNGFPNFIFIKYWVVHSGLIIYILFVAVVWDFRLKWKDLWNSFFLLQGYVLLVYVINRAIGSNYIYVVEKPPTASALDYFGPWPVYILVCQVIFLFLSFLVYLPYLRHSKELESTP